MSFLPSYLRAFFNLSRKLFLRPSHCHPWSSCKHCLHFVCVQCVVLASSIPSILSTSTALLSARTPSNKHRHRLIWRHGNLHCQCYSTHQPSCECTNLQLAVSQCICVYPDSLTHACTLTHVHSHSSTTATHMRVRHRFPRAFVSRCVRAHNALFEPHPCPVCVCVRSLLLHASLVSRRCSRASPSTSWVGSRAFRQVLLPHLALHIPSSWFR